MFSEYVRCLCQYHEDLEGSSIHHGPAPVFKLWNVSLSFHNWRPEEAWD